MIEICVWIHLECHLCYMPARRTHCMMLWQWDICFLYRIALNFSWSCFGCDQPPYKNKSFCMYMSYLTSKKSLTSKEEDILWIVVEKWKNKPLSFIFFILAVVRLWWWCLTKLFHSNLYRNRKTNEVFKIVYVYKI